MSYIDALNPDQVRTVDDIIEFTQTLYGVVVNWQDKARFKGMLKDFFKDNPHVDVPVIAKAIVWAKETGRKVKTLNGVMLMVTQAHAAGALPELDPSFARTSALEAAIFEAITVETDEYWRTRLVCANGTEARQRALNEWRASRKLAVA